MPLHVVVSALIQLSLMLLVAGGYFLASRRFPILANPLCIILFVTTVGVVVSVCGEVWRDGWTEVPAMARRSAIGSVGWGVIIAGTAWSVRRGFARWNR
jgi:hypothetical protein